MLFTILDLGLSTSIWIIKKTVGGVYSYVFPTTETPPVVIELLEKLTTVYDQNMELAIKNDQLEMEIRRLKSQSNTQQL